MAVPFIETASGAFVPLAKASTGVKFSAPTIGDIAHHLSRINRFTGAIQPEYYSVAQHSLICADAAAALNLGPAMEMEALMHDAAEAFVGDISSPMKCALKGASDETEHAVMRAVRLALWDRWPTDWERAMMKAIDLWVLRHEAEQIVQSKRLDEWDAEWPVFGIKPPLIIPMSPNEAKGVFHSRYQVVKERCIAENMDYAFG